MVSTMRPISFERAQELISRKEAGFYAAHCDAPMPHADRTAVHASGSWYLLPAEEFRVIDLGLVGSETAWDHAYRVEVDDTHPIVAALQADAERMAQAPSPSDVLVRWHLVHGAEHLEIHSHLTAITTRATFDMLFQDWRRDIDSGPASERIVGLLYPGESAEAGLASGHRVYYATRIRLDGAPVGPHYSYRQSTAKWITREARRPTFGCGPLLGAAARPQGVAE